MFSFEDKAAIITGTPGVRQKELMNGCQSLLERITRYCELEQPYFL